MITEILMRLHEQFQLLLMLLNKLLNGYYERKSAVVFMHYLKSQLRLFDIVC